GVRRRESLSPNHADKVRKKLDFDDGDGPPEPEPERLTPSEDEEHMSEDEEFEDACENIEEAVLSDSLASLADRLGALSLRSPTGDIRIDGERPPSIVSLCFCLRPFRIDSTVDFQ
ncbi:hypothetical protein OESDEN_18816, partial [Oesophagostomum dentatum]